MLLNSISVTFTDNPDYLTIRTPDCVRMVSAAEFAKSFKIHYEQDWTSGRFMGFIPRKARYRVAIDVPTQYGPTEYRWNGLTAREVRKFQDRFTLRTTDKSQHTSGALRKALRAFAGVAALSVAALSAALFWPAPESPAEVVWKVDQTRLPSVSKQSLSNIALVAREAGIFIDNRKGYDGPVTPFFVFSHPSCEDCNALDSVLEDVDPKFAPIILPAGFAHNPESMVGIAAAYCSTDPAKTWMRMARTDDIPAPPLEDTCQWKDKSIATSLVADMLGQVKDPSDWPMIVAPNGKVTLGGYAKKQELRMLNEHLEINKQ